MVLFDHVLVRFEFHVFVRAVFACKLQLMVREVIACMVHMIVLANQIFFKFILIFYPKLYKILASSSMQVV